MAEEDNSITTFKDTITYRGVKSSDYASSPDDYYDKRKAELSSSKEATVVQNSDDNSFSYTINDNIKFECSSECSFGIVDKRLSARNSGFSYSRMYYSTREPDYQFIFRIEADMYCNICKISYTDQYVLVYVQYRKLSGVGTYTISLQIDLNDLSTPPSQVYIKSDGDISGNNPFYVGYKSYTRDVDAWKPYNEPNVINGKSNIVDLKGTRIAYVSQFKLYSDVYKSFKVETPTTNLNEYKVYQNLNIKNIPNNIKYMNPYNRISYNISKSNLKYFTSKYDTNSTFKLEKSLYTEIFVEGVEVDTEVDIYTSNNKSSSTNIEANKLTPIYLDGKGRNILYAKSREYYYLNITDKRMMRGYIYGNVTIDVSCYNQKGFKLSNMVIRLNRSDDGCLIGYYDIKSSSYKIPNLDLSTKYDVILVDKGGVLENQVLSNRYPTPYTDTLYNLPIINYAYVITDTTYNFRLMIDYDPTSLVNVKVDDVFMYYSNNQFTQKNYKEQEFVKVDGLFGYIFSSTDTVYNYYMFELKNAKSSVLSNLVNIEKNNVLTTKGLTDDSTIVE